MRHYTKILILENKKRLNKLIKFRQLIIKYFKNSYVERWSMGGRIEEKDAQEARTEINMDKAEAHSIILNSGTSLTYIYTPPPAVGGRVLTIDLIENIFNLDQIDTDPRIVIDCIDRAIGRYKSNHKSACWRIINPFFYLGWLFDIISDLPFIVVEKFGFNQQKAKASATGRLVKGVLYLIAAIVSFIGGSLAILDYLGYLDFLEPVKQSVYKLLGSNKTN